VKQSILARGDPLVERDYLMVALGINSFLRGCDLVRLTVGDVMEGGRYKQDVRITTTKTGKVAEFYVNDSIRLALDRYFCKYPQAKLDSNAFLFFATQGARILWHKHLETASVGRMIRLWCHNVGLKGSYGSHTLRKTGATQWYRAGESIESIQMKLTHSSQSTAATRAYLGITRSSIREREAAINL
jgi:integrase